MPMLNQSGLTTVASAVARFQNKNTFSSSNLSNNSKSSLTNVIISGTPGTPTRTRAMSKAGRGANVISLITTKLTKSNGDLMSKSANELSASVPAGEFRSLIDESFKVSNLAETDKLNKKSTAELERP